MLYAILCYDREDAVCAWSREQDAAVLARLAAVERGLAEQDRLGPVARLLPTTTATTVRKGRAPLVVDGPFAQTREQLLGFLVVDCPDLEAAIGTARDLARATPGKGAYEIRPIALLRLNAGTPPIGGIHLLGPEQAPSRVVGNGIRLRPAGEAPPSPMEPPMADQQKTLTTRQGHPVSDNQSLRSVGERGPATLENYQFIEKITHFDRERIPERVVHARGTGAHGWFEAYGTVGHEPATKYTRAKVLTQTGVRTPVFVRFSTVVGAKESPETARDPRGFAVKFKTVDGVWDLVGNNLKIFFIRDAIKFPDMIHAFKPDPVSNRQEPWRFYDFVMHHPESLHMVTWVKSPWGIPAGYRHMEGSSVNTYKLVNDRGDAVLCKFSFEPKQGVRNLTSAQAAEIQARDVGHATRDLYDAIERGEPPEWEMCVQIMSDDEHPELDFDPLDDTKRWPEDRFPLLPVGRLVLDRNPSNFFAEVEQAAFGTGVLVDGIDFSDDKMLQGRTLSYSDTQRYRVGPNYLQLPINAPAAPAHTNQRDGQMAYHVDGGAENPHVNYEPSSMGGLREAPKPAKEHHPWVEGHLGRYETTRTADDYRQAGERYRTFESWERDDLVANLGADLKECPEHVALRMVWHFWHCDEDYGRRVAQAAGVDLEKAKTLPPLEGKPAPGERRAVSTYTSGRPEKKRGRDAAAE